MRNLKAGGAALIRYPGKGELTFAGSDAKSPNNPWMNEEELSRTAERLMKLCEWKAGVMPQGFRSYSFASAVGNRAVNCELFTRLGPDGDTTSAPKIIREMEEYWNAYQ